MADFRSGLAFLRIKIESLFVTSYGQAQQGERITTLYLPKHDMSLAAEWRTPRSGKQLLAPPPDAAWGGEPAW